MNTYDDHKDNLIVLLKEICSILGYFKNTKDNIVTRCIYCGDSNNKYSGHFYIWKHYPIAFCFRCSTSSSISLLKWANDLQPITGSELSNKLKEIVKSQFMLKIQDTYSIFDSKDTLKNASNISLADNKSFEVAKNLFVQELNRRNIQNSNLLLQYISHGVINLLFFEDVVYNYIFVGLKSIFGSGYHLRNLKTNQTLQKRLAKNDVFLMGCNYTPRNLYVVEGIYDAISIMLNLIDGKESIRSSSFLISSVGYFISDCYKYIQNHIPENIVVIYDSDVDNRIIKNQSYMYKYLRKITNISVYKVKQYKDISEALSKSANTCIFDHIVSVL